MKVRRGSWEQKKVLQFPVNPGCKTGPSSSALLVGGDLVVREVK